MGNSESSRLNHYRSHNVPVKLPMPEPREIDERFEKVLASMNLPPDKVKVLTKYDNKKKWELICDQDRVEVKNPPSYYIHALHSYLDPSLRKKTFRRKITHSTKTLRDLEISLRTNHIGWVREFLNEENRGLDVLVNYLAFAQYAIIYDRGSSSSVSSSPTKSLGSTGNLSIGSSTSLRASSASKSTSLSRSQTLPNRRTLKNSRAVMDRDDVHVCITCLRAIMNYQYGFNLVMAHPQCINEIALSLNNRSLRTKSLVLELLAAVCLVRGGHDIILRAFDNFKSICNEVRRFTRLMFYFKTEAENIDFMVSCMQFINIVVHSVEDMNFRVHLQHEFTLLGLDTFLDELRNTESDRLKVQIQAYLDNMFDVSSLLEDSEMKITALERVESLEEQLLDLNEKFQEQEYENMTKIVQLEKQLSSNLSELTLIKPADDVIDDDVTNLFLPVSMWHGGGGSDPEPPDDVVYIPPSDWLHDNQSEDATSSHSSDSLARESFFTVFSSGENRSSDVGMTSDPPETRLGIDNSFMMDPEFGFLHGLSHPFPLDPPPFPAFPAEEMSLSSSSSAPSNDQSCSDAASLSSESMSNNTRSPSRTISTSSELVSRDSDSTAPSSVDHRLTRTKPPPEGYQVLPGIGETDTKDPKQQHLSFALDLNKNVTTRTPPRGERFLSLPDVEIKPWSTTHSVLPSIGQAPKSDDDVIFVERLQAEHKPKSARASSLSQSLKFMSDLAPITEEQVTVATPRVCCCM